MASAAWVVVMARAWRDGDRQLIRMVAHGSDEVSRVAVEASSQAAAVRFAAWLEEFSAPDAGPPSDAQADGGETAS